MRRILLAVLLSGCTVPAFTSPRLRVASFRSEVTPEIGEPLIWVTPATKVEDPLWAKGIVLEDGSVRYVLCAVDWCGLSGATHLLFRNKIAAAAGTSVANVAVHSVHQHAAPYIDGDAYQLLRALGSPPLLMSDGFLQRVTERLAQSVRDAVEHLEPFDRIGIGEARVVQVASTRRILKDGKIIVRYSTGGTDPAMAALPEGSVDPVLRTVTFAKGDRPVVRLHFYATHPQTFCCDGRISGDFVSAARERLEVEDHIPQVYFTGCAGDVTVGKYNNGSSEARNNLASRLEKGMRESIASTRLEPAPDLKWQRLNFQLPKKGSPEASPATLRSRLENPGSLSGQDLYRSAISLSFAERRRPLQAFSLTLGRVHVVLLPGEPMLEFQMYAQQERPDQFIAVAGYGDMSPGYLCTDLAFSEGGYEPGASNADTGTEARIKEVIRRLLSR